jgi:hypothetical protein
MINILDGKYDKDYFNNMTHGEINKYFKNFKSYEDFLRKEKMPFITEEIFNNWYYTICLMDVDTPNIKSLVHRFITTSLTFDGIKYSEGTIKELIKNYQKYKDLEYERIYKEFELLITNFNNNYNLKK